MIAIDATIARLNRRGAVELAHQDAEAGVTGLPELRPSETGLRALLRMAREAVDQAEAEFERAQDCGDADDVHAAAGMLRLAYEHRAHAGAALAERLFEQAGLDMAAAGLR